MLQYKQHAGKVTGHPVSKCLCQQISIGNLPENKRKCSRDRAHNVPRISKVQTVLLLLLELFQFQGLCQMKELFVNVSI